MPRNPDVSRQSSARRNAGRVSNFRRDLSFDVARGIGIILVVLGSCLDGLKAPNFFPAALQWPSLATYFVYLFNMPPFFVASGHLASGSRDPAITTLWKLARSILYPYFLWSLLRGLVQVYLSDYTSSHVEISALYGILWIPIIPYGFLYALFFCYLGYLAIRGFSHTVQLGIAVVVFAVPLFFTNAILNAHLQIVLQTTGGFLYFVLGAVSVSQVKQFGRWAAIAATVLFAVFATAFYQSQWIGAKAMVAMLPAAVAGIAATLAWSRLLAAHPGAFRATLAFLGRYWIAIYVMHIFFTAGVRIALNRLGTQPSIAGTALEILAATAVGIALPLGINWVISRFGLDSWFGLRHMETT